MPRGRIEGQEMELGARDAVVNNIGSMLDPRATRIAVPER